VLTQKFENGTTPIALEPDTAIPAPAAHHVGIAVRGGNPEFRKRARDLVGAPNEFV